MRLLSSTTFSNCMVPSRTSSDHGPQFTSQVCKSFCNALCVTVSLSSGFHPQTNGQVERANQELEVALQRVTASNPSTWSSQLPWIKYAHNSLCPQLCTSIATGMCPFECSQGYQPPLFPIQENNFAVPSVQAHIPYCCTV